MKFSKVFVSTLLIIVLMLSFGAISSFADSTYVVAGVESLCGSNWNPNDSNNAMSYDSSLGYYKKDYFNVPAGAYEVKVVENGTTWYGDSTNNNVKFNVTSPCTVTVLFNADTKEIKLLGVNISFDINFTYSKVTAVGSGEGAWLNGAVWDPKASSNDMKEIEKGLYEITYKNIPQGTYQLKFAFDGDWAHSFGVGAVFEPGSFCEAVYNGGNIFFDVTTDSDVKITLDIRNFDFSTKTGGLYKIEITESEPGSEPSIAPSTPTNQPGTEPGDTTASAKPTVAPTPSTVPSVKPSAGPGSTGENVDTGDSSDYILTALVAVFVMSVAVFAITTLKKKEN